MQAQKRPSIGQIEFVCWHIDSDKLCAAAKKRGWNENGDYGPLDYVEHYDYETGRSFASKDAAIEYGKSVAAAKDFFGCASVRRRQYRRDEITPEIVEWKDEYEWIVNQDGIDSEQAIEADDAD